MRFELEIRPIRAAPSNQIVAGNGTVVTFSAARDFSIKANPEAELLAANSTLDSDTVTKLLFHAEVSRSVFADHCTDEKSCVAKGPAIRVPLVLDEPLAAKICPLAIRVASPKLV